MTMCSPHDILRIHIGPCLDKCQACGLLTIYSSTMERRHFNLRAPVKVVSNSDFLVGSKAHL